MSGFTTYATVELFYWLRFVGLAGLLALTLLLARRRWLRGEEGDQTRRILLAWLVFLVGFSLYLGVLTAIVAPIILFYVVAVVAIWVATPALVTIAILDIGAKLLEAERTSFWLGAAIIAYVALTFAWLGLLGVGPLLLIPGLWVEFLAIAAIPSSAALIWWSWLPARSGDAISRAFE